MADALAGLDEQQRAAATLGPGPAQVIAPAGSGKTATLVARIGFLVSRGVAASRILVVTFNRDAAAELDQRIRARIALDDAAERPEVRTLHALARQVVLDAGMSPHIVADRLPLLRQARRRAAASVPPDTPLPPAEVLDTAVSRAVVEGDVLAPPLSAAFRAYHDLLAVRGAMDFDGLMATALERLRTDPTLRRRWQSRFEHVLVDEFQDVDRAQLELVSLLAEPQRNLFVVGDDDQTIYAWRLADVRRILDFPDRYPDARRVILETNYRCPPAVVAAADRLIAINRERVPKRLQAAAREPGPAPVSTFPMRGQDAVDRLAVALAAWANDDDRVAVLARTRADLVPLAGALLRAGTPHATAIRSPLEMGPAEALLDDLASSDPGSPPALVLLAGRAQRGWRRADPADELGEDDHGALDVLIGWAVAYTRTDAFLAAAAQARARLSSVRRSDAPIELATVHASKGREWPTVVVLGLEVERFPNGRALVDAMDPERALEEERRLAYVAVTRCRRRLVLAFDPERASPFVAELMGARSAFPTGPAGSPYRPTSSATVVR